MYSGGTKPRVDLPNSADSLKSSQGNSKSLPPTSNNSTPPQNAILFDYMNIHILLTNRMTLCLPTGISRQRMCLFDKRVWCLDMNLRWCQMLKVGWSWHWGEEERCRVQTYHTILGCSSQELNMNSRPSITLRKNKIKTSKGCRERKRKGEKMPEYDNIFAEINFVDVLYTGCIPIVTMKSCWESP